MAVDALVQSLFAEFAGRLSTGPRHVFEAITAGADIDPADPNHLITAKSAVASSLATGGAAPSDDVIRARIVTINAAAKEWATERRDPEPLFKLSSRKLAYDLRLSAAMLARAANRAQSEVVEASNAALVYATPETTVPPDARWALPNHQVFVSHGHESQTTEAIVKEFARDLQRKLRFLPPKYADRYTVSLWIDHFEMQGGQQYGDQAHPQCAASSLALLLLSDKFYQSEACKAELRHFTDPDPCKCRHMQLQKSGTHTNRPEAFKNRPVYPAQWDQAYTNLLEVWSERAKDPGKWDRFVERIRDAILHDLDVHYPDGPLPPSPPVDPRKRMRMLLDEHGKFIDAVGAVAAAPVPPDASTEEGAGSRFPALDRLCEWATATDSRNRVQVLLGSFGAGKTTLSQLFARELRVRREQGTDNAAPLPLYLDLRRASELVFAGERDGQLTDIIKRSMADEVRDSVDPEALLAFLRNEPSVVIFDGLDEIGNRIGGERAARLYRSLLDVVPTMAWTADRAAGTAQWDVCPLRVMITCRSHFFRTYIEQDSALRDADRHPGLGGARGRQLIDTIYMAPFTPEQIRACFVRDLGAEAGEAAWATIAGIPDLPGLAQKPLFANYIAELIPDLTADRDAGRRINAARLYDHLFHRAIVRDADKQPLVQPNDRVQLLTALAGALWQAGADNWPIAELEQWFDAWADQQPGLRLTLGSAPQARSLALTELRNANLLVRQGDDRFGFAHTSFREYFLARYLRTYLQGDSPAVASLPSVETLGFYMDLIEAGHGEGSLSVKLAPWLRRGQPQPLRALAVAIYRQARRRGLNTVLPAGADLSHLDLRRTQWVGEQFAHADFHGTNLQFAAFTGVKFDHCHFVGAMWGGVTVETSTFTSCINTPEFVESVRLLECNLDLTSSAALKSLIIKRDQFFSVPCWNSGVNDVWGKVRYAGQAANCVSWNHSGTRLAVGYDNGQVLVIDDRSGCDLWQLVGHIGMVKGLAWNPDGIRLATVGDDELVRIWDTSRGVQLLCLSGHTDWINSVTWHPDGSRLASAGADGSLRIWNVLDGSEMKRVAAHSSGFLAAAWHPDGSRIASGGEDGMVRIWDASHLFELQCITGHHDRVLSIAWHPDGARLASAGGDGAVRIWNTLKQSELNVLKGHLHAVHSVVWHPDGTRLATAGDDGTVRIWDNTTSLVLCRFAAPQDRTNTVAWHPDGSRVAAAHFMGSIGVWDALRGQELNMLDSRVITARTIAWRPDGAGITTTGIDGAVRFWCVNQDLEFKLLSTDYAGIDGFHWKYDGSSFAMARFDGKVIVSRNNQYFVYYDFEGQMFYINNIKWETCGRRFVFFVNDDKMKIIDSENFSDVIEIHFPGHFVNGFSWHPDGSNLIIAGSLPGVMLVDALSGAITPFLNTQDDEILDVAWSPDGIHVAVAGSNGNVQIWDANAATESRLLVGHLGWVHILAWNNSGTYLASGGVDGSVRVWDVAKGAEIHALNGHIGPVQNVAWHPDGTRLASSGKDGTVRIWNASDGSLEATLVAFPDAWARLDADDTIIDAGGEIWRYAHGVQRQTDGSLAVVNPWLPAPA